MSGNTTWVTLPVWARAARPLPAVSSAGVHRGSKKSSPTMSSYPSAPPVKGPLVARRNSTRGSAGTRRVARSEEHTSELQSPKDLVCCLLLEKKKYVCVLYVIQIYMWIRNRLWTRIGQV